MTAEVNRRGLLGGLGVALTTLETAGLIWPVAACAQVPREGFITRLCDLTIPATDTPGAVAAGVPAFVVLAVERGLEGTTADALTRFDAALNQEGVRQGARSGFGAASPERQAQILADIDARVFARGGPPVAPADLGLWSKVKALIVAGYYTSEIGGSKELRYELVPGRWDPDLPTQPGERAWSSDWTAVTFG